MGLKVTPCEPERDFAPTGCDEDPSRTWCQEVREGRQVREHGSQDDVDLATTIADQYDRMAGIFDHFPIAAKEDVRIFVDRMPETRRARALDIGCGTGRTVYELSPFFQTVFGIDISSGMIEVAKARCRDRPNVVLDQSDVRDLAFADGSLDYIVSHTTFHHLRDDLVPTLQRVKQMVKPGGKVVFIDIIAKGLMKRHASAVRRLGAILASLYSIPTLGPRNAYAMFKTASDPAWMEHLKLDRFLDEESFLRQYGSVYPDAHFAPLVREFGLNHLMVVEWCKPQP